MASCWPACSEKVTRMVAGLPLFTATAVALQPFGYRFPYQPVEVSRVTARLHDLHLDADGLMGSKERRCLDSRAFSDSRISLQGMVKRSICSAFSENRPTR